MGRATVETVVDASAWGDVVIPDLIDLLAAERQHAVCQMLRVLGMQHASASLYVEHVRMQTDVGLRFFVLLSANHKYHRKHGRQCADRSGPWLRSSAAAASAAKVQEVNKQLASSYFAPTMPFWLAEQMALSAHQRGLRMRLCSSQMICNPIHPAACQSAQLTCSSRIARLWPFWPQMMTRSSRCQQRYSSRVHIC